jgi:hypothetical protein
MKNLMLSVIAICLFSASAIAQNNQVNFREKVAFGFKLGGNYSNIYDTEGEEFTADGKYGSAVGIFVGIPFGQFVGIQPEIMYSQKGFKAEGQLLGSNYSFVRTTEYIDLPLLLTIKPAEFITILAGPQLSFLLKKKDVFTTSVSSSTQEESFDNDNLRKNTLGFSGGLDFNFNHVVVGTRVGFDIQDNNGDGTNTKPRYKNTLLQATFGFRF